MELPCCVLGLHRQPVAGRQPTRNSLAHTIRHIYHSVGSDVTWHVVWHHLVGSPDNNHSTNSPVVYAAGGTSVIAFFICLTFRSCFSVVYLTRYFCTISFDLLVLCTVRTGNSVPTFRDNLSVPSLTLEYVPKRR